ncbi:glycosyltransferase [Thermoanaerobacter uzonensis]|uniref:glycosyltransferase n=1 Tax=Thermoanaerobacter uzonensis TaxID=447593 RepID=UPI003D768FAE
MNLGNAKENRLFVINSDKKYFITADDINPEVENNSLSYIIKAITEDSTVLDVGCSYGYLGEWLVKNKNCQVYGIDIDEEAVEHVKEREYYKDVFHLDLDYPEKTKDEFDRFAKLEEIFDFVVCADVLEHLKNPTEALEFVVSKLKFSGQVLISVPNIAHMDIILNLLESKFNYSEFGILDNTHLRFFTKRSFVEWIKNANEFYKDNGFKFDVRYLGGTTYVSEFLGEVRNNHAELYNRILSVNKELEILQHIFVLTKVNNFANTYGLNELLNNTNYVNAFYNISEENSMLKQEIKNLTLEISNLKEKFDTEIASREQIIENFTKEIEKKEVEIQNLRSDLNNKEMLIKDIENKYDEVNSKLEHIYNSHGWKLLLKYYKIRDTILPDGSKRRKFLKILMHLPSLFNKTNVKKSIYYIKKNGIKAFVFKAKKELEENYISFKNIPIIETDMLAYRSQQPLRLDKPVRGVFNFPINGLNRIEILTANYKKRTSGVKLTLIDVEEQKIVREITLSGEEIKDNGYSVFEFQPLNNSENKKYEFILQGLGEPYAAIWYNSEESFEEIRLDIGGSINCKIYSVEISENLYSIWIKKHEPNKLELEKQKSFKFNYQPKVSIIVPVWNTPKQFLIDMIESVRNQTYSNWELCIADGGSKEIHVKELLEEYTKKDNRIKVKYLPENKGIVGNSNEALSLATGDYVALLDHDDMLAPFALFEVVKVINENSDADFIYSDEDKISEDGSKRFDPHFKPDWSPDTLRSYNYITHLSVIKKELLDKVGWFKAGYEGSQDYDLILRCAEKAKKIIHIPKILYHWRVHQNSVAESPNAKLYAYEAAKKALKFHIERLGLKGRVNNGFTLGYYKINYDIIELSKVSIIIPNKDHKEDIERCINSIIAKSTYKNYEIIIIENGSTEQSIFEYYNEITKNYDFIRILVWNDIFNYSAINNFGARHAKGEILLFLNNDTEVINSDWLERMIEHVQRKDVGVVGAKLYYPGDTIQHAGVIIGIGGFAGHSHKHYPSTSPGYFGRLKVVQNLSAVTGACLMVRKNVFEEVRGFDEEYPVALSDIDFCLKVRNKGYLVIWTPFAELYHYESKTRGYEDTPEKVERFKKELEIFTKKWKDVLQKGDPYYNPNLTLKNEDFSIRI